MNLKSLNTHAVGVAGLLVGGAAIIVPPVAAFFKLLSDPPYLVQLAHALEHAYLAIRHHGSIPGDEQLVLAQLCAACFSILGGFTIALLMAYYGRPKTIPSDPATTKP